MAVAVETEMLELAAVLETLVVLVVVARRWPATPLAARQAKAHGAKLVICILLAMSSKLEQKLCALRRQNC